MNDQRRHDPLGLAALLDHGTDAAPGLDGASVLVAARRRRARRRGVAALTAGVAAAGVSTVLLTGIGPLTTAPAPPAGSTAPSGSTTVAPPTSSTSTPPTWDGTGERFALIGGSTCDGVEGVQPETEVLCFSVLDRAATDPLAPRPHCSTGPLRVGPTPGVVPNRTLGDGVEVEVRTEHDLVQGQVGDRFFVVYGTDATDEVATEAAIRLCRAAPPIEQVLAYTVVHPGPAVLPDDDDLELVRRLAAYAASPSAGLAAEVPFADRVQVGQAGRVVDVGATALQDGSWPLVGAPGGALEPVQALDVLAGMDLVGAPSAWRDSEGRLLDVRQGAAPTCGSDLGRVPAGLGDPLVTLVTAEAGSSSCLDRVAVAIYATDEGRRVYGVTVERYEP